MGRKEEGCGKILMDLSVLPKQFHHRDEQKKGNLYPVEWRISSIWIDISTIPSGAWKGQKRGCAPKGSPNEAGSTQPIASHTKLLKNIVKCKEIAQQTETFTIVMCSSEMDSA